MRRWLVSILLVVSMVLTPVQAKADTVLVEMVAIDSQGQQESIGVVTAKDTDQGLELFADLRGLPPGEHGFHLHSNASCDALTNEEGVAVAGLGAGGHWDPDETGQHLGPFGNGHRGDLSRLIVSPEGNTPTSVVAPRLRTDDLSQKALIVHAGGDTYSDTPPLGGGGARIACGLIP